MGVGRGPYRASQSYWAHWQAKKWAAERVQVLANGAEHRVACGDVCEACYVFWRDSMSYEYTSVQSMVDACKDKEVEQKVAAAYRVHSLQDPPTFAREAVVRSQSIQVEVQRSFRVLTESELRSVLGVPRLLKQHTKSLHSVRLACESDPSKTEVGYVFSDPVEPFRRLKLKSVASMASESQPMPSHSCAYESQGRHFMKSKAKDFTGGALDLLSVRLASLTDFTGKFQERARASGLVGSAAQASRQEDGDDDDDEINYEDESGDDGETVVGPAAAQVQQSPARPLPPVPSFSTPPAIRTAASRASASMAGDTDSARSGDDDGDQLIDFSGADDADGASGP